MKRDKKAEGRKNRQAGARFELKVRKDLERNWIVAKWTNNLEPQKIQCHYLDKLYKLVSVKNKFRGKGIPMMLGAGFPDFIAFKQIIGIPTGYIIYGVEVKSNGYLKPEEKEKCRWLLNKKIFSKILIASKGKKRGEIIYMEFEK